jgi:hypothetical protein
MAVWVQITAGDGQVVQPDVAVVPLIATTDHRCCEFDHPHPEHPCGRRVIPGVTVCPFCGNPDDSPECKAAGCWIPSTEAHLDSLYAEAWGIPDPGATNAE